MEQISKPPSKQSKAKKAVFSRGANNFSPFDLAMSLPHLGKMNTTTIVKNRKFLMAGHFQIVTELKGILILKSTELSLNLQICLLSTTTKVASKRT